MCVRLNLTLQLSWLYPCEKYNERNLLLWKFIEGECTSTNELTINNKKFNLSLHCFEQVIYTRNNMITPIALVRNLQLQFYNERNVERHLGQLQKRFKTAS